ncbi:MAG: ABC transporter ATP-binding protein [Armatimonadota bacterium]
MSLLQEEKLSAAPSPPPEPAEGLEAVLMQESADLVSEASHRYGRRDVRVSRAGVAVYDEHDARVFWIPMADIRSARTEPLVGGGRLELTTREGIVPVVEFTASVAARFSEMARGIEQLARGEELHVKLKQERTRCEACGRLLPEKDGRCAACVKRMAVLGRIFSYMTPYRGRALIVALTSLGGIVASLALPEMTRRITDEVLTGSVSMAEAIPKLLLYVGGMLLSLAIGALFQIVKGCHVAYLSGHIAKDIRAHVYQSLERLQLSFYDKKQLGAITSRVTQDTDRIWGFLVEGVPYLITALLMVAGTAVFGLWLNWKLTIAVLSPVPLLAIAGVFFWKPMSALFYRVGQKWGRFHTHLNESIAGIRMVKAFTQEGGEWEKFSRRNNELAEAGVRADRRWYIFSGGMMFFTGWGSLINWTYGGYLVLSGEMTLGTLLAANQLLWQVYGPLQWFAQVNQWFSRAMAGAERIFEVIDQQPEAYDNADAVPMPQMEGAVTFENVRFGYDKSNPVLKGIQLDVKPGEMIGLVGKSGAGKSTTVSLLCRFYEVDSGTLKVDGVDIKEIKLEDLRKHIGIVPQEPFLFAGTVAENIAYGKPGASMEEIMTAARAACAHDFIAAKPDGYDTQVGEKGAKLSGGERQRVAIARAILHNPKILILDEATSSVDVETERKIQQAIATLVAGRTTFAIAHRLSTLRNADRLVVLEKGEIVEIGTHAELMEKQGEFYKLVQTQAQTSAAFAVSG